MSTHDGLVVVPGPGADTDDHLDFPLPIKVVLEEVCQLRVTVGHNPLCSVKLVIPGGGGRGSKGSHSSWILVSILELPALCML